MTDMIPELTQRFVYVLLQIICSHPATVYPPEKPGSLYLHSDGAQQIRHPAE